MANSRFWSNLNFLGRVTCYKKLRVDWHRTWLLCDRRSRSGPQVLGFVFDPQTSQQVHSHGRGGTTLSLKPWNFTWNSGSSAWSFSDSWHNHWATGWIQEPKTTLGVTLIYPSSPPEIGEKKHVDFHIKNQRARWEVHTVSTPVGWCHLKSSWMAPQLCHGLCWPM